MNDNKRKATETLGQAARRLLAELDARNKRSGGFKRPERFKSEETVPASSEKCRESERKRGEALHDSRQSTAYPAGGVTGGGFLIANNDNRAVGVMASEAGVSVTMHPTATSADLYRHDFTERESFRNRYARWGEW